MALAGLGTLPWKATAVEDKGERRFLGEVALACHHCYLSSLRHRHPPAGHSVFTPTPISYWQSVSMRLILDKNKLTDLELSLGSSSFSVYNVSGCCLQLLVLS